MVLILHGWGQNKEVWQTFINSFLVDEISAIDLPGFGQQDLISTDWGVPEYADWVTSQIETLNPAPKSIVLLGHSFGGRISALIASRNPGWLKAVILCGTPALYRPTVQTKAKILLAKAVKKVLPFVSLGNKLKSEDLVNAEKSGLNKIFRKTVVFDQTELLPKIKVPTLLLWGSLDNSVPVNIAREMHTLIPNSQLEILDGVGHQIIQDSPYLSYAIIKKFLENI